MLGLNDRDNTQRCIASVTRFLSADTWEYKTLTFEADTTGAFDNDNAESLRLDFGLVQVQILIAEHFKRDGNRM